MKHPRTLTVAGLFHLKDFAPYLGDPKLIERKSQLIQDAGLLEYFPVNDNAYQRGGFGGLKSWLARTRVGFSVEAAAMNLSPPRGVLLVGVQGCASRSSRR